MKTLYIDIETSPIVAHVWSLREPHIGINQIVEPPHVLCAAWAWDDGPVEFGARWAGGKKRFVRELHTLLDEADAVVHYNGTSFDVPHINREFLECGLTPPAPYAQIDLYRAVRSTFRFPSNKLDYVTSKLGLGEKLKTDHSLWTRVLKGDADAQAEMQSYNEQDVVVTRELHATIRPWIKQAPNAGLYVDSDEVLCPACGSDLVKRNGVAYTGAGVFQRYKCNECGRHSRSSKRLRTTPLREA